MIHYHGTPIGGTRQDGARFLVGRHALVPYPRQDDMGVVADACQSFVFDNGAFSVWKRGEVLDVEGYARWCEQWWRHPGFDWALIPDVIDGDEAGNDALLRDWELPGQGLPVWHMHESTPKLERAVWWARMEGLGIASKPDGARFCKDTPATPRWRGSPQTRSTCLTRTRKRWRASVETEVGAPRIQPTPLRRSEPTRSIRVRDMSMHRARHRRSLGSGQWPPSGWAQLRAQFGDVPTARQRHRVKKRTEPEVAAEPNRGRGRPAGSAPAKTSRERQDEFRSRLREQGRKALRLSLPPEVIDEFDSLRVDGASREETFEALVSTAARRRKR